MKNSKDYKSNKRLLKKLRFFLAVFSQLNRKLYFTLDAEKSLQCTHFDGGDFGSEHTSVLCCSAHTMQSN